MVGGTEDQFAALAPLFRSLGREPRFVGAVGKAAALKLALNQLIAAETLAFGLSLGLIRRAGISVDTFMTILRESALYAPTFGKKLPRLLKRDYHHPNFSTRHLLKDVRLFVREAGARGLVHSKGWLRFWRRPSHKGLAKQIIQRCMTCWIPRPPVRLPPLTTDKIPPRLGFFSLIR